MLKTVKITEKSRQELRETYKDKNAQDSLEWAVQGFLQLRSACLAQEVRGKFTRKELEFLFAAQNGIMIQTWHAGLFKHMKIRLIDFYAENNHLLSEPEFDSLITRLSLLSYAAIFFLEDKLERVWSRTPSDQDNTLETFLKKYEKKHHCSLN